jgi:hypothetical protein
MARVDIHSPKPAMRLSLECCRNRPDWYSGIHQHGWSRGHFVVEQECRFHRGFTAHDDCGDVN